MVTLGRRLQNSAGLKAKFAGRVTLLTETTLPTCYASVNLVNKERNGYQKWKKLLPEQKYDKL